MINNKSRILGIPFDNLSEEEILKKIEDFFLDTKEHTLMFLSVPLILKARRNKAIRLFIESADIVIPTGKTIYNSLRFLKKKVKERIDPSGFVKRIMMLSVSLNKNVFLFGGKRGVVDSAVDNLKKEIPRLFIIGKHSGDYDRGEHEDIINAIKKASPDFFFIGLGSPWEEYWLMQNRKYINSRFVILIEKLIDVYGGRAKRLYAVKRYDPKKIINREIPTPGHYIKRIILVPIFLCMVLFEKLFWKH